MSSPRATSSSASRSRWSRAPRAREAAGKRPATMSERTARGDELLREEIRRIVAGGIGRPGERAATIRALGRAMPFVRHRLGVLRLRRIPELHLKLDDTAERGTRLLTIMQELEAGHEPDVPPLTETLPPPKRRPSGGEETAPGAGAGRGG